MLLVEIQPSTTFRELISRKEMSLNLTRSLSLYILLHARLLVLPVLWLAKMKILSGKYMGPFFLFPLFGLVGVAFWRYGWWKTSQSGEVQELKYQWNPAPRRAGERALKPLAIGNAAFYFGVKCVKDRYPWRSVEPCLGLGPRTASFWSTQIWFSLHPDFAASPILYALVWLKQTYYKNFLYAYAV